LAEILTVGWGVTWVTLTITESGSEPALLEQVRVKVVLLFKLPVQKLPPVALLPPAQSLAPPEALQEVGLLVGFHLKYVPLPEVTLPWSAVRLVIGTLSVCGQAGVVKLAIS